MSEPLKQIADASARLLQIQQERAELEQSANAHEHQARQNRLKMAELKKQEAELHTVIGHANVRNAADNALQEARAARELAEHAKADAERLREQARLELDLIAKKKSEMEADSQKASELAKAQAELMIQTTEKTNATLERIEAKEKQLEELIAKANPEDKQNSG